MKTTRLSALRRSAVALRHGSSLHPCRKKITSSHVTKLPLDSVNSSVGLQFSLFPLSSMAFTDYSEMQHHLKQTITTLEKVILASAEEPPKVDYIVFRYGESVRDETLWTGGRMRLSLTFLRKLAAHLLPTVPLVLSMPLRTTNEMTVSYAEDIFETLHRVGWMNLLLELPHLDRRSPVKEVHPFCRSGVLKNWQLLLERDTGASAPSSQWEPHSLTTLFPWILEKGFLDRFSVGLSVDVRSSLLSLTLLQQGEVGGDVEKLRADSNGKEKEFRSKEKKLTAELGEQMQRSSQCVLKDRCDRFAEMAKESQKGLKGPGIITLDAPTKEFTDMLLAQHQCFQLKKEGVEEETIMLAQFLQETFSGEAKKKNSEIQEEKKKESHTGVVLTNQNDMELNGLHKQRRGLLYWKLLGEIAQRTHAQYLCTAPCINPASLNAWKQAWAATCMCSNNEIRDEPFLSTLESLPVVVALWPILSPTQLERECRLASSNGAIQSDESLESALLFAPTYLKQNLQSAIDKIPHSILQHAFNSVLFQKRHQRRETQILHDGGSLRLSCLSSTTKNPEETVDDVLRILGAGAMGRKSLLSGIPAEQRACVQEVEMMFRGNTMKRVLGEMVQSARVEKDTHCSSHLLFAVPPDTEFSVLLASLQFLRST